MLSLTWRELELEEGVALGDAGVNVEGLRYHRAFGVGCTVLTCSEPFQSSTINQGALRSRNLQVTVATPGPDLGLRFWASLSSRIKGLG